MAISLMLEMLDPQCLGLSGAISNAHCTERCLERRNIDCALHSLANVSIEDAIKHIDHAGKLQHSYERYAADKV